MSNIILDKPTTPSFEEIGLNDLLLPKLSELGYEIPSPIQAQGIPVLLQGKDLLAQAQTGTGKTAAFALPILTQLDLNKVRPQAIVLAPTRELAIQVAESFQTYAQRLRDFRVLPIYGGTSFYSQLQALKRGVHVVVGTPGRVMDHLRRGTLKLTDIQMLVLDEADEMLKMGFIDDVEWILQQIPNQHQTALFSATLPTSIQKVANKYLRDPVKIQIKSKSQTVDATKQFYTIVSKQHKVEALTRFLEIENVDAAIIFTRTKTASAELAHKLEARGYSAAAINGDMSQELREKTIKRIKNGTLDIVVATDVAARGIDVERVSHVINYDIPYDPESYVHRIGRTGRAGREGVAILFIEPRERRMLKTIERATRQEITVIQPPSIDQISEKREASFVNSIHEALASEDLDKYRELIQGIVHSKECSELDVAAALARLLQKNNPIHNDKHADIDFSVKENADFGGRNRREDRGRRQRGAKEQEEGMTCCRVEVGRNHGLQPKDIVGMIANEARVSPRSIGRISILDDHTLVDVSNDVVNKVISATRQCRLRNQAVLLSPVGNSNNRGNKSNKRKPLKFDRAAKPKKHKKRFKSKA